MKAVTHISDLDRGSFLIPKVLPRLKEGYTKAAQIVIIRYDMDWHKDLEESDEIVEL